MDIPTIQSYEDLAVDTVTSVINKAHEKLGVRQNLFQIAHSRNFLANRALVNLGELQPPLPQTGEKFIKNAIEKVWRLTDTLSYHIEYRGGSQDEASQYYYFEVIFSQLRVAYPIPQVTCSVFFRVEDKHLDPPETRKVPEMVFRVEGQRKSNDVRYVKLIEDWILEVLMTKMEFMRHIEELKIF